MRRTLTDLIVLHCSATRPERLVDAATIREWHISRGFSDVGYHYVVLRTGLIEFGRPPESVGAHVAGQNTHSVGICLIGGLMSDGSAGPGTFESLYTTRQEAALLDLVRTLRWAYPLASLLGHRDLSPDANQDGKIQKHEWLKTCPGFDVRAWARTHNL